jgi:hypothetical protein
VSIPARLSNPVSLEAVIQLRRHLLKIRASAGYNYDLLDAGVNVEWKNEANAGFGQTRPAVVSILYDLDSSRDLDVATRTNGITSWRSTVFLSGYLFVPDLAANPYAAQAARALFHADLHKYFFPSPGTPNTAGIVNPWTLPTELGQTVIREFYITRLNHDPDYQKAPVIKVDIELTLFWAALLGDLYVPK